MVENYFTKSFIEMDGSMGKAHRICPHKLSFFLVAKYWLDCGYDITRCFFLQVWTTKYRSLQILLNFWMKKKLKEWGTRLHPWAEFDCLFFVHQSSLATNRYEEFRLSAQVIFLTFLSTMFISVLRKVLIWETLCPHELSFLLWWLLFQDACFWISQ